MEDSGTVPAALPPSNAPTANAGGAAGLPGPGVRWLICIIASIGFAFDIYELLMLPLIARPALAQLAEIRPGTGAFNMWIGILFFVPAFVGGAFGLFGGYLTDLLGRRRMLTFSILLYAFAAFAAGFSTSIYQLLFFRCLVFIGVCLEFVAAIAWLAELFPEPKQRESVLGYTQAFSSIGGLLVAVVYSWMVSWAGAEDAWRYTLMSGLLPALPLIIIRPFLPESPVWEQKRAAGTLQRPSFLAVFAPEYRQVTIVTTLMFALSYGAAFGAIQQMNQIVPGLNYVKQATAQIPEMAKKKSYEQSVYSEYAKVQEIGGLAGRSLFVLLALLIASRRWQIRTFLIPGMLVFPITFWLFSQGEIYPLFAIGSLEVSLLGLGIFLCGLVTVGQFSFWGNYLPLVYPVHLRGTGESVAANIGGRMLGTSFAALTALLASPTFWPETIEPADRWALTAMSIGFGVFFLNFICSFFLPEPKAELEEYADQAATTPPTTGAE